MGPPFENAFAVAKYKLRRSLDWIHCAPEVAWKRYVRLRLAYDGMRTPTTS
jgi:hypothetical protein